VLVSMFVALTVTPALCLLFARGKLVSRESPLMRVLKRGYLAVLTPLIKRPLPAVAAALVLLLGAGLVVPPWAISCCPTSRNATS
jgi:Cu/Ag efflux pump CusA